MSHILSDYIGTIVTSLYAIIVETKVDNIKE
jgi:hypothetical protein